MHVPLLLHSRHMPHPPHPSRLHNSNYSYGYCHFDLQFHLHMLYPGNSQSDGSGNFQREITGKIENSSAQIGLQIPFPIDETENWSPQSNKSSMIYWVNCLSDQTQVNTIPIHWLHSEQRVEGDVVIEWSWGVRRYPIGTVHMVNDKIAWQKSLQPSNLMRCLEM
jgi:hypothetical protein